MNNSDFNITDKNGAISPELVGKLLKSITEILEAIAQNTAPIERIYDALSNYSANALSGGASGTKDTKPAKVNNNTSLHVSSTNGALDSSITTLVGVLAQLAKG